MSTSILNFPTVEAIEASGRQSSDFYKSLLDDLAAATRLLEASDTSFARRTYCRTLMALFEGIVSDLRAHVLTFETHVLGKDEIATLKKRAGALESAFHSLDLYTNVAGATTPLERDSKEWQTLKIVIRIRNRITHPTSLLSFEISDLDLSYLRTAEKEILDLLLRGLKDAAKARIRHVRALRKRWKEEHSVAG